MQWNAESVLDFYERMESEVLYIFFSIWLPIACQLALVHLFVFASNILLGELESVKIAVARSVLSEFNEKTFE